MKRSDEFDGNNGNKHMEGVYSRQEDCAVKDECRFGMSWRLGGAKLGIYLVLVVERQSLSLPDST